MFTDVEGFSTLMGRDEEEKGSVQKTTLDALVKLIYGAGENGS